MSQTVMKKQFLHLHNFTDLTHVPSLPFNRSLLSCSLFPSKSNIDRGSRGVIKKTKTFALFSLLPHLLLFSFIWYFFRQADLAPKKTTANKCILSSIKQIDKTVSFGRQFGKQWAHSTLSTMAAQGLASSNSGCSSQGTMPSAASHPEFLV